MVNVDICVFYRKMELSALLSLFITLLITIHFFISWWRQYKQYKILPPGPTPIPFLGTPKYMDIRTSDKDYAKLSQKYGPIFTIWMLSEPMVVLCGYETVRDALVNHAEEFSARPIIPTLDFPTNGYSKNTAMTMEGAIHRNDNEGRGGNP
ncbi:cytochrome P450 2C20-like [Pyxicephalus adspersus]|uniref:cytochrome P450 2C20-like n=1 Tax=Pyxicephalus adspersus TaxID=30357 RepID=UPI003B5A421F